jgi:hypothetical protein
VAGVDSVHACTIAQPASHVCPFQHGVHVLIRCAGTCRAALTPPVRLAICKRCTLVQESRRVRDLPMRSLPSLSSTMPMYDVLQLFKIGRAHMAVLREASPGVPSLIAPYDDVAAGVCDPRP